MFQAFSNPYACVFKKKIFKETVPLNQQLRLETLNYRDYTVKYWYCGLIHLDFVFRVEAEQ